MSPTAVDCMGFAGGFTLGMVQAGFELLAKRELPGGFGVANCEANRALLGHGWDTQVAPGEEWTLPASGTWPDVVFGNPPCSGFSTYSETARRGIDSPINSCMWHFADYVGRTRPLISIMESVRPALTLGRPLMRALRDRVEERTGERYTIHHVFQNALELGGAGKRPRYFFVLARVPFGVEYPTVQPVMLRDVIGDLAGLKVQIEPQRYNQPPTWWSEPLRSVTGFVDGHAMSNAPVVTRSIELVKIFREHGMDYPQGWKLARLLKAFYDEHGYVPHEFYQSRLPHYIDREWRITSFGFAPVIRWEAAKPAKVIHGHSLDSFFHPWIDRFATHREVARVMGYPDDWTIEPMYRDRPAGLVPTWGKGITVQCGKWIGDWVARSLNSEPGQAPQHEIGDREFFMDHPQHSRKTAVLLPQLPESEPEEISA